MLAVTDPGSIAYKEPDTLIKPPRSTIWPKRISDDLEIILDGNSQKKGSKVYYEGGYPRKVNFNVQLLDDGRIQYQSSKFVKSAAKILDSSAKPADLNEKISEIDYIFDPISGEIEIVKSRTLSRKQDRMVDDRFFSGNLHAHEKLGHEIYNVALSSTTEYCFRKAKEGQESESN